MQENMIQEDPPLATARSASLLLEAFSSILFLPLSDSFTSPPSTCSAAPRLFPRPPLASRFFSRSLLTPRLIFSHPPLASLFTITTFGRALQYDNLRRLVGPSSRFSLLVLSTFFSSSSCRFLPASSFFSSSCFSSSSSSWDFEIQIRIEREKFHSAH